MCVCFWKPHSKVVFGLTMGTCGMQMIRMSELKKKEKKLSESRAFFILGMVTWSCRKNLMLFHDVSWFFIYTCWIDWEYLSFLGEFSCELMTRKPTSKVDDLRSTYLMKITHVSTKQNPQVMGLFIWRSRKNSGYFWGKKSTFLVAGTAPLDALLPLVHWCMDR